MPRHFTLAEAQELLPTLQSWLQTAVEARQRMAAAEESMQEMRRRVAQMGGVRPDRALAIELKMRRDSAEEEIRRSVEAISSLDVQVKDLDSGLIDFPTLYRGREVLLCYRLGEMGITHWHETDAGFSGRQPISSDFVEHNEGSEEV
jgi:hypothetical protein